MAIEYRITLDDNHEFNYCIEVERPAEQPAEAPSWTRLEYNQCSNCPLKKESCSHCPAAVDLHRVVEDFHGLPAFKKARVWVRTPERMCFAAVGDTCYGYYVAQAEAVKALGEALPVIYAGVAMGQFFKGSLRPDPALAFFCGLNREAVPAAELDEAQALCYLRRQEVAAGAFAEGVNLVCARGRALGFAKRIGNRVNNMYPNTLRIIKR